MRRSPSMPSLMGMLRSKLQHRPSSMPDRITSVAKRLGSSRYLEPISGTISYASRFFVFFADIPGCDGDGEVALGGNGEE